MLLHFCTKNGEKNLCFCESVHFDLHKSATKEVFENVIESGYPLKLKWIFESM